jgi:hypothetical protein
MTDLHRDLFAAIAMLAFVGLGAFVVAQAAATPLQLPFQRGAGGVPSSAKLKRKGEP